MSYNTRDLGLCTAEIFSFVVFVACEFTGEKVELVAW